MRALVELEFNAYTIIIVSQKRGMTEMCDQSIIMDTARIVEDGTSTKFMVKGGR